jgi:predicted kinase
VATLFLMVGLPCAGKTARAKELAARHGALRLSPDARMIPQAAACPARHRAGRAKAGPAI